MSTKSNFIRLNIAAVAFTAIMLTMTMESCQKSTMAPAGSDQESADLKIGQNNAFTQLNLDADVDEYSPVYLDPNLVNAWGLALSDEGEIWVSSNGKGLATIYDADGVTTESPINIPFHGDPNGGKPSGAIYNFTSAFVIPNNGVKSEFIYVTENGTIVAASEGNSFTVADRSSFDAVYKGLTIAKKNDKNYLYATNFKQGTIDVFDKNFNFVTSSGFIDPTIPAGYAPFNILSVKGQLFVTYAKQLAPDNEDDEAGLGNGYVDIFNTDGSFVKRFASQGTLNSPWAIALVPGSSEIMIGNFGNGKINVYDSNGNFKKFLKSNGVAIQIEGLWALTFPFNNLPASDANRLYFTAGPDDESHGVFGYLLQQ